MDPYICFYANTKSWLIGKDSDAGRDWGQEEKGTTEDEMAGWHHRLDGREFQWTPGVGDGQGGLACCNSWGCTSVYSCHVFLISSASVRSIPFLSFIEPIFAWNVSLVSIIFFRRSLVFAAKDGEALYSQQKQDQELTVAQTMNSLLPNSDLNWRK